MSFDEIFDLTAGGVYFNFYNICLVLSPSLNFNADYRVSVCRTRLNVLVLSPVNPGIIRGVTDDGGILHEEARNTRARSTTRHLQKLSCVRKYVLVDLTAE